MNKLTHENQTLKEENMKRTEETVSSNNQKNDACAAVIKLDEARLVMNKLLGP